MIQLERRGPVAVLRLDRPRRGNALVPDLVSDLVAAVRDAEKRPELRALVLTGAGAAFCAGADLVWLGEQPDPAEAVAALVATFHEAIQALRDLPFPVVAAVNCAAAGGGLSLALAADYRLGCETTTFTAAYFRLSLTPDGGSSALLTRAIGASRAMDLLLTNRRVDAEEARALGLLSEVVPTERLLDRAVERALSFSGVAASTLIGTRHLLDAAMAQPLQAQLQMEAVAIREAARRDAFRAALASFLQGRTDAGG
jgi:2-(1,2-epoxy-1,2-dihydrophenyl)acetyl-CoA isomerase